jgi:hypothetical protein
MAPRRPSDVEGGRDWATLHLIGRLVEIAERCQDARTQKELATLAHELMFLMNNDDSRFGPGDKLN